MSAEKSPVAGKVTRPRQKEELDRAVQKPHDPGANKNSDRLANSTSDLLEASELLSKRILKYARDEDPTAADSERFASDVSGVRGIGNALVDLYRARGGIEEAGRALADRGTSRPQDSEAARAALHKHLALKKAGVENAFTSVPASLPLGVVLDEEP